MNLESLFPYITPILLVLWVVSTIADKIYPLIQWLRLYKWLFVVGLTVLTTIPFFGGLSAAALILSLNPNYSIGLTILLVVILTQRLCGVSLLSSRDVRRLSLWNIGLGLVLYAGFLGFLPYDIYPMGYNVSLFFWIICGLTIILVLFGSRLQWVFLSYIAAWDLGLLPSPNFIDYMIDIFLFLLCTGIVVAQMVYNTLLERRKPV